MRGRMRGLIVALALLSACQDPEAREPVPAEAACQAQALAWCTAFELCPGNACSGIPECRPDRTTDDWLEVCPPAFAASCMAGRAAPVPADEVTECLDAIAVEECSEFGLPEDC